MSSIRVKEECRKDGRMEGGRQCWMQKVENSSQRFACSSAVECQQVETKRLWLQREGERDQRCMSAKWFGSTISNPRSAYCLQYVLAAVSFLLSKKKIVLFFLHENNAARETRGMNNTNWERRRRRRRHQHSRECSGREGVRDSDFTWWWDFHFKQSKVQKQGNVHAL